MVQSDHLGLFGADIAASLGRGPNTHVPFNIIVKTQDVSTGCVDLVIILLVAREEFHVIFYTSMVMVQLDMDPGELGCLYPGVVKGDFFRPGFPDKVCVSSLPGAGCIGTHYGGKQGPSHHYCGGATHQSL